VDRRTREWLVVLSPPGTHAGRLPRGLARGRGQKPFAIAVQVELADDPTADPEHLHLGFRAGIEWFQEYFGRLEAMGLDHAIVGIRNDDREAALSTFADEIIEQL